MEQKLLSTRILAGVLFVLLLISLFFLLQTQKQLKTAETSQSLTAARDSIRKDCTGPQGTKTAACAQDLQDLSDTLSEFTKSIGTPGTSGSATATATPAAQ